MHMADALMSPAVGGAMWAATAATTAYCAKKVREEVDESKIPLMGVAGAFIFAAQMLNFTIPGTGSSGHLGGGLILAVLLGPEAAFLVMASVLGVQALFFADGGLLAIVKDGDLVKLDINNRRIDVLLPEKEIKNRFKSWVKPDLQKDPFVKGWMKQYALSVGSAAKGALVDLPFKSRSGS